MGDRESAEYKVTTNNNTEHYNIIYYKVIHIFIQTFSKYCKIFSFIIEIAFLTQSLLAAEHFPSEYPSIQYSTVQYRIVHYYVRLLLLYCTVQ